MGMSMYEKYHLYKLNFCDLDVYPVLKPFGQALIALQRVFTTNCHCCTGARIALGLALAYQLGRYAA
jgi:hypothetical protein